MSRKSYSDELQRALSRPDAEKLCRQIDAYAAFYDHDKDSEWPEEYADDFDETLCSHWDHPDKALAYVVLAAARSNSPGFIARMACGTLEDILDKPSPEMVERIVAEARKSARFRWMLDHPYKMSISNDAWKAIEPSRMTGPHEEPPNDRMPPRD